MSYQRSKQTKTITPGSSNLLQRAAVNAAPANDSVPPVVHDVLNESGQPLDARTQAEMSSRFGHDFSQVRVHSDSRAAESARSVSALAYTVGHDVVFGAGQYQPGTTHGNKLLAHELTHTIQQGQANHTGGSLNISDPASAGEREADHAADTVLANHSPTGLALGRATPQIQRQVMPDAAKPADDLTTRSVSDLMADETYMDNHLKSIQFYSAELAVITYDDGSTFRLGLVPGYITAPVEGVDYRTLRETHIPIIPTEPGKLQYVPRGKAIFEQLPDDSKMSVGDVLKAFTATVTFKRDAGSKRIVPTRVNSITAPRLCAVLREAEAEYVKNFDAAAAGGKKVFEKLKVIVELVGLADAAATAAESAGTKAAGKAAGATTAASISAEKTLTAKFLELLKSKVAGSITVEGVGYGDIEVGMDGTQMIVRRSSIVNVSRIPNQGKLMQSVWESAAIQAAKQAGAKSVQIGVRTVQNAQWADYLMSRGYTMQVMDKMLGQFGVEQVLVLIKSI